MRKVLLLLVAFAVTISCAKNEYTENESLYGAELNLADVNMDYETALEILKNNTNVRIMTNDGFEAVCDTLVYQNTEGVIFHEEDLEAPEFYASADGTVTVIVTESALSITANNIAEERDEDESAENSFFITNDTDEISRAMASYQMTRSADDKGMMTRLNSRAIRIISSNEKRECNPLLPEEDSYVLQSSMSAESSSSDIFTRSTAGVSNSVNNVWVLYNQSDLLSILYQHQIWKHIVIAQFSLPLTTGKWFTFRLQKCSFSATDNSANTQLARFQSWVKTNYPDRSGRDMFCFVQYQTSTEGYAGLAYVGTYQFGATNKYSATSWVSFHPTRSSICVLAHELCHNLGGRHNSVTWSVKGSQWYNFWQTYYYKDLMNTTHPSYNESAFTRCPTNIANMKAATTA